MEEKNVFCNPAPFTDGDRHTNPDPFLLRWCGKYYCYATDEFGVKISESEDMAEWTDLGYAIKEAKYRNYWAPSVIYRNGIFYMYYSNVPLGTEDCHEECLKLAVADRPEGPFQWKKTFFDKFSIDSHPILWNGKMYLFYSVNDWIGTDGKVAGTCILADEMVTPEELSGNPREIVLPSIRQEIYERDRFGDGRDWYTIEGAAPVTRGPYFWVLYSANAYVNEDYFVGAAVAEKKENFMEMQWQKFPSEESWYPLLKKNTMVEGTGHNTVEKAPNMMDDWIIYHGRNAAEEIQPGTEQREMYLEPLYFNGKEILCFGPTTEEQEKPGAPEACCKGLVIQKKHQLAESSSFYIAEFWLSAQNGHAGMRYGIFLDGSVEGDYLELQIHSGKNEIQAIERIDGIQVCLSAQKLEKSYRHTVPHLIRVEKRFSRYEIQVDAMPKILLESPVGIETGQKGMVGILPYFTKVNVHSFALARGLILEGKELRHLRDIYDVSLAVADESGLHGSGGPFTLQRECRACDFVEEFQLESRRKGRDVVFQWDGSEKVEISHVRPCYSVYYIRRHGTEQLIADGKIISLWEGGETGKRLKIHLENSRVVAYRLYRTPDKSAVEYQ